MNSTTVAAIISGAIALYAVYIFNNRTTDLKETERSAEDVICREIAADTLSGSETLATYMQTRCPARLLTEHLRQEEDQ